jgi:hypothetical protein
MTPEQLAARYGYPTEYKKYDTQYQGVKEAIGWMLWHKLLYTSAVTVNLQYFNAIPATLDLGNMQVAGQLSMPEAFFLRAIRVRFDGEPFATAAAAAGNIQTGRTDDIIQLAEHGVLQLTIGHKIYGQWPLHALPAGGGIVPMIGTAAATVVQEANNGIADPRAVYSLSKPIFIAPQIHFQVDVLWPAGPYTLTAGNINVLVMLDGDLIRPAQ